MKARRQFLTILFPAGILLLVYSIPASNQMNSGSRYLNLYRYAEKIYNSEESSEQTDSLALDAYLQVIQLLVKERRNDSILCDSYFKAGIFYQTLGHFDKAITPLRACLNMKVWPPQAFYLPALYTGNSYYSINRFDSARYYYEIAQQIAAQYPGIEGIERLYNTQGVLNFETGNYFQSINYFEKAISLVQQHQTGNNALLVNYKSNLASAYRKLNNNQKALDLYTSLLSFGQNNNELYHNIASTYLAGRNSKQAIYYLQKVAYLPGDAYNQQKLLTDLADAYLTLHNFDSAGYYLQQAVAINNKHFPGKKSAALGNIVRCRGRLQVQENNYAAALQDFQNALQQYLPSFNSITLYDNPVHFSGIFSVTDLFETLLEKAIALQKWYSKDHDKLNLEKALDTYQCIYALTAYIERTYESDEAKLFINTKKYATHRQAISLGLQLYQLSRNPKYLEQVFIFDEQNKASILSTNLAEVKLKRAGGIPDTLIAKENNIKETITRLSLQASSSQDSNRVQQLLQQRADAEIELENLQDRFESFAQYKRLKYANTIVPVTDIQRQLPKGNAILSYHVGDSSLLIFFISRELFEPIQVKTGDRFFEHINRLSELLQQQGSGSQPIQEEAAALYNQLIKPVEERISPFSNLVIIPDDELGYIPFEVLRDEKNNYLLNRFAISYNYSCSLLNSGYQKVIPRGDSLLAMAPFSEVTPGMLFPVLPASRQEIASLKGRQVYGKEATRQFFTERAAGYTIIHLATHAQANSYNPSQSYIAFSAAGSDSSKLFLPEIYNLSLNHTRLTILSACETGSGQLVKGEGVMSLSRAFSYAGCPNIITSLWKADDKATAYISGRLHYYLQKKYSIAEALQKAKLDYIDDDTIDRRYKTPAYWAHLLLIGEPENKPSPIVWYRVLFLLALLLLAIVAIKRFRFAKRNRNLAS